VTDDLSSVRIPPPSTPTAPSVPGSLRLSMAEQRYGVCRAAYNGYLYAAGASMSLIVIFC